MVRVWKKHCPKCSKRLKYRVPRKFFQRLIPFSKRFRCLQCNKFYLRIMT